MNVIRVDLDNFRNYKSQVVEFSSGINVITGENAQGKTNLLESVFMLSSGKSFRTRLDREILSFNAGYGRVYGKVFSHSREQEIDILLNAGSRKKISCNGVKKNASELSETFRTVLFCPDDLNMIKAGAKARRRFMDVAISQLRPTYAELITEYNRLYEHKRSILSGWREKPSLLSAMDDFSDSMDRCSAKIIRYRAAFVKRLQETAAPIHSEFSGNGEELRINYETVSTIEDPFAPESVLYEWIVRHRESHREAELASGLVLTGVHKDDLYIEINGLCARSFASQGQTRTAALSLKMAERDISRIDTGETPVLLLDDVLSELDSRRQEFVLNHIGDGQTLITCCEDQHIRERTGGRVITVQNGTII